MDQMPNIRPDISVLQYGIRVDSLTPQLREFFGVRNGEGMLFASVEAESAPAKAGLKVGDVITAVDGKRMSPAGRQDPPKSASTVRKGVCVESLASRREAISSRFAEPMSDDEMTALLLTISPSVQSSRWNLRYTGTAG